MTQKAHFTALENMYLAAPINEFYKPTIDINLEESTIEIEVRADQCHSAGGIHGSVYFKILDDAAFFAANAFEEEVFVLTTSFTTYITRPVSSGKMTAVGRVVNKNRTQWIAEAVVYNNDKEVGRGSGIFVRSKMPLSGATGYGE